MLVSLPLLDSSPLGFHARAHSNLVSLLHPGLLERTGVAGPADGGRGPGVCAAGQLLSLGERLGSAPLRRGSPLAGGGEPRGVHPERVPQPRSASSFFHPCGSYSSRAFTSKIAGECGSS